MSITNATTTKPQELSSSNWGRLLELVEKPLIGDLMKKLLGDFGLDVVYYSKLLRLTSRTNSYLIKK